MSLELTQRVRTSRGEIAFEVLGEGPPVVLVHGTPSRGVVWRHLVADLVDSHRVYVFDLLGFGDSERDLDQEVSVAVHGRVLAELIGLWKLVGPAVVGHDIGGATALRAHLVEGVGFAKIALLDAVVLRPWITPTTRRMQRRLERYRPLPDPGLADSIREHLRSATSRPLAPEVFDEIFGQWEGARGQALYLRNLAQLDESDTDVLEQLLATISVPVLVLWGADDAWLSVATSTRIAAAIPGSRRVVVPEAGHFSMEDQPGAVAEALRRFLE